MQKILREVHFYPPPPLRYPPPPCVHLCWWFGVNIENSSSRIDLIFFQTNTNREVFQLIMRFNICLFVGELESFLKKSWLKLVTKLSGQVDCSIWIWRLFLQISFRLLKNVNILTILLTNITVTILKGYFSFETVLLTPELFWYEKRTDWIGTGAWGWQPAWSDYSDQAISVLGYLGASTYHDF